MVKVLKQKASSFNADGKREFEVVEYQNLNEALEATGLRATEVVVGDNGFLCYGKYKLLVVIPVEDSCEDVLMLSGRYSVTALTKRAETLLATLFPDMPHRNSYLFKSLPEVVKQLQETGEVRVGHTEPKQLV